MKSLLNNVGDLGRIRKIPWICQACCMPYSRCEDWGYDKKKLQFEVQLMLVPSGNLLHNYVKIPHAIDGWFKYFYGHFQ
jgi:hypothetical protein